MKKQLWFYGVLSALALMLMVSPTEANFVQCPGGGCGAAQGTTDEADIINGTPGDDNVIDAQDGDDLVFGGAGVDVIVGDDGDDVIFGGPNSDLISGNDGNDIFLPGPDDLDFAQEALGGDDNDTFNVFAGEVIGCTLLYGELGLDVVNLIGFGPYSAATPFGIPDFEIGFILIVDPITSGRIFVAVSPDALFNTEVINGLPSPNVTFLTLAEFNLLIDDETGTDPCPPYIPS